MPNIRVALIDDHPLVRAGIQSLLSAMDNVEVVAEGSDGRDAIAIAAKHEVDVFLMDIAMTGMNGLEATKRLVASNENARVVILSMHEAEEYVVRAMKNGAHGFVLKSAMPGELATAIRQVAQGGIYFSPSIGNAMRLHMLRLSSSDDPQDSLSPRQLEILQAIAEGSSTKEIADALCISPKTVETHRSQLMQKLNIHNVPGLVRYAIRQGIISAD